MTVQEVNVTLFHTKMFMTEHFGPTWIAYPVFERLAGEVFNKLLLCADLIKIEDVENKFDMQITLDQCPKCGNTMITRNVGTLDNPGQRLKFCPACGLK